MSMAITTRYIGPSNTRGSRVKATARKAENWGDKRMPEMALTDSWDDAHSSEENHCRVAHLCAVKFQCSGVYVMGDLPGSERVYVNIARSGRAPYIIAELTRAGKTEGRDFFHAVARD